MNIDKVKKDFSVYLHKDKETGILFYVGKGTGKRAYSKSKRGFYWQKKIDSLTNGYEIEIVKKELSETEAYELEYELIKKYGQEWNNSGTLVNQTSGGDVIHGEGISMSFELPEELAEIFAKVLEQKIDYKDLTETEQKDFINSIVPKINELSETLKAISQNNEEDDSMLLDSVSDFLDYMPIVINRYNSNRISFRELAEYFEDYIWDIEADLEREDDEQQTEGLIELAKTLYEYFNERLNIYFNQLSQCF